MSKEIKRATGLLVIEVVNSNPNGDPDRESDPRQRPNGCGEISPVSFKRKLRDLLDDHDAPFFKALPEKFSGNAERYSILEHRGRDRKQIQAEMGNDPSKFMDSAFVRNSSANEHKQGRRSGREKRGHGAACLSHCCTRRILYAVLCQSELCR